MAARNRHGVTEDIVAETDGERHRHGAGPRPVGPHMIAPALRRSSAVVCLQDCTDSLVCISVGIERLCCDEF